MPLAIRNSGRILFLSPGHQFVSVGQSELAAGMYHESADDDSDGIYGCGGEDGPPCPVHCLGYQPPSAAISRCVHAHTAARLTNQLTDGGPPPTFELPDGSAGPPFGAAALLADALTLNTTHTCISMTASRL